MKILASFLMLFILLISQSIFAHSDHSHRTISDTDALSVASNVVKSLTSRDAGLGFGKLSQSWASLPAKNTVINRRGSGYYIVSVINENEQKTLYILMSSSGEVFDVNFFGVFEGIE